LNLRELGYPSHLAEVAKNGLKCNSKEADLMVCVLLQMNGKIVIGTFRTLLLDICTYMTCIILYSTNTKTGSQTDTTNCTCLRIVPPAWIWPHASNIHSIFNMIGLRSGAESAEDKVLQHTSMNTSGIMHRP